MTISATQLTNGYGPNMSCTSDPVLPIDQASRLIVPALRELGDSVEYVEFDGRHEVPAAIGDQAVAWLAARFSS